MPPSSLPSTDPFPRRPLGVFCAANETETFGRLSSETEALGRLRNGTDMGVSSGEWKAQPWLPVVVQRNPLASCGAERTWELRPAGGGPGRDYQWLCSCLPGRNPVASCGPGRPCLQKGRTGFSASRPESFPLPRRLRPVWAEPELPASTPSLRVEIRGDSLETEGKLRPDSTGRERRPAGTGHRWPGSGGRPVRGLWSRGPRLWPGVFGQMSWPVAQVVLATWPGWT